MESKKNETKREYKKRYRILQLSLADEISHGIRVSNLAYYVAKERQLPESFCYEMAIAGMVHDIGKLELVKYVYNQEETLIVEEIKYVRSHSTAGYALLQEKNFSDTVCQSILYHHENFDGSGYPSNLKGDEIPLGARILRVCDVFAALTSNRPYRKKFDPEEAIALMIDEIKNFDVQIFLAFLSVVHDEKIMERLQDNKIDFRIMEEENV
ncbi:MAG: HD domain-containing phosphohydrolase [Lachnospiraceae bacterium]|nr:HD domain-containing protein [Robinsoniella sp.]MDY3767013.1 HD domain-containing phosphohydrolase [Lachnospiraceae bacterium]